MKTIELNEVKNRFPQLCETVAQTGESWMILSGRKPLVTIAPVSKSGSPELSVWELRAAYEREHGALDEDFVIPSRQVDEETWRNPLDV